MAVQLLGQLPAGSPVVVDANIFVYAANQPLLAIDPLRYQEVAALARKQSLDARTTKNAILVRNIELRPLVRKLFEAEFPTVRVLSEREVQSPSETFSLASELG
jgi:flagellar biosynthesis component FlhA